MATPTRTAAATLTWKRTTDTTAVTCGAAAAGQSASQPVSQSASQYIYQQGGVVRVGCGASCWTNLALPPQLPHVELRESEYLRSTATMLACINRGTDDIAGLAAVCRLLPTSTR